MRRSFQTGLTGLWERVLMVEPGVQDFKAEKLNLTLLQNTQSGTSYLSERFVCSCLVHINKMEMVQHRKNLGSSTEWNET